MKTKIAIIIILFLISCDNVFSQNEVKQSSLQKVDVPLLTVKNKSIEYVLDTVISFMHKKRGGRTNRKYCLNFEETENIGKFIAIYLIYTNFDLNDIPKGMLKYKDNTFFVYGNFKNMLRKEKKCGKKNKATIDVVLYELNIKTFDTIDWYFKYTKNGFEIIRIDEYGY